MKFQQSYSVSLGGAEISLSSILMDHRCFEKEFTLQYDSFSVEIEFLLPVLPHKRLYPQSNKW